MKKDKILPGWNVILMKELRSIWFGWGGSLFLLILSFSCSAYIVLLAVDPEINVLSQQKLMNQTVGVIILVGTVAILLLNANTFSGERDNNTLESLLLTPTPRWQIAIGKFLATLSLWPGVLLVSAPYVALIGKGTATVFASLGVLIIIGTLLVILSAGIGLLVSSFSPTNLFSVLASVSILLLLAAPVLLPGSVREIPVMSFILALNPIMSAIMFQSSVIIGADWTQNLHLLIAPLTAAVISIVLCPYILNNRLSLQGKHKA